MKITRNQLRRIIRQEKSKILSEARIGGVGIGFAGWEANTSPDFAKSYGESASVVQDFAYNPQRAKTLSSRARKANQISEQPDLSAAGLQTYKLTMLFACKPGDEEYILNSIEEGMEFDETAGEGILEYDVKQETGGNY